VGRPLRNMHTRSAKANAQHADCAFTGRRIVRHDDNVPKSIEEFARFEQLPDSHIKGIAISFRSDVAPDVGDRAGECHLFAKPRVSSPTEQYKSGASIDVA
jgi:hypothetical protein